MDTLKLEDQHSLAFYLSGKINITQEQKLNTWNFSLTYIIILVQFKMSETPSMEDAADSNMTMTIPS